MAQSNDLITENPFWRFSLQFYDQGNVASTCIALQDGVDADVNVLLYCCWVAYEGATVIASAELTEIIEGIEPWQSHVVSGLRKIRRDLRKNKLLDLRDTSEELLQLIKECELESERLEQWILYQSGQREFTDHDASEEERIGNARTNLNNYLGIISGGATRIEQQSIHTLGEEVKKILVSNSR